MLVLIVSFFISMFATFLLIHYKHIHGKYSSDFDTKGIQKFHSIAVPRIGGVVILVSIFISLLLRYYNNNDIGKFGLLLIVSALPVFITGLLEDITKKVSFIIRLLSAFVSSLFSGYLLGAWLNGVGIGFVDHLFISYSIVSIFVTCFAVSGVTNAFNIIDGYNGLSSMVAVIILLGISYVSFIVGDFHILFASLSMVGALLGFLIWNFPRGLVFLGDGGAYLIGFWVAVLSVLITVRNPEVSKWFAFLLCIYPIVETIFTIYRRIYISKTHPGMPDALHLHQLIYKRIVKWGYSGDIKSNFTKIQKNSITSIYLWLLCMVSVVPAVLFWKNQLILIIFSIIFIFIYIWFYWSIVRFKIPKYLIYTFNRLE